MTIKQQGGIFGRNPTFNNVTTDGTLTSSSAIGVRTTSPNGQLDVQYDSSDPLRSPAFTVSGDKTAVDGYAFNMLIGNNMVSDGSGGFTSPASVIGSTGIQFLNINSAGANSAIRFLTATDDNTTACSPTEMGRFTENGLAFPDGKGIDFSATSGTGTSELFSDYEEGTWTPVVSDATSGGNTASGTFKGEYTKIGNAVTVNGSLININTSGMTSGNTLRIQGLPYLAYNFSGTRRHIGSVFLDGSISFTSGGFVTAWIGDNTQYVSFVINTNGSGNDNLEVGDLTSGSSDIFFSLTYYA